MDAEGYLSETVYDLAGRAIEERRYDQALTVSAASTLATLKPLILAASSVRSTRYVYDGAGQLTQQTNYEGTVSSFTYDLVGQRTASTVAKDTSEARTTLTRYDFLGRVTQELSAEGAALLATTPAAQIESVWDRYGVRYEYDSGGRRINAISRPDDQQTNTTLFYYDEDNRLRVSVNALGEVQESRYNALGQLSERIAYTNRISTTGLTGGAVTTTLTTLLTSASDATKDARTQFSYSLTGQVASTLSAAGASVTSSYNAFGELATQVQKVDATRSLTTQYSYDLRGLLISTKQDPTALNLSTTQDYDAFGRVIAFTDARGKVSRTQYDRLGRVILTREPGGAERVTTYDGFSRIRTTRDALGNATRYDYDDATRSSTITTPEGIVVSTVLNRHGQALTVTAAGITTSYQYDANGALKSTSDSVGTLESSTYDRAGRQLTRTDARGVQTRLTYDAANRVLTRTVDAGGLALTTTYVYNGQGQVTRVTEPGNRVTATTYDADGRVTQSTLDPAGLAIATTYQYDASGNVITVTEGAGSAKPRVTEYRYDVAGRRTQQIVDPGTGRLNLTTTYKFDANGNVTRRIDARGLSLWSVYDDNGRVIQTVDATGALTQSTYDAEGQLIATRQSATRVSVTGFGDAIPVQMVTPIAQDRVSQSLYDKDGRERFNIDAAGGVTERTFDAHGNVIRTRQYAKAVAAGTYTTIAALNTALTTAGNNLTTPAAADRMEWTAYDLRGQAVFTVDAAGAVARLERDAAGNVIATTAFATLRATNLAMDLASLTTWAAQTSIATVAENRLTRFWYDAAGREVFKLDAEGALSETRYLDADRKTTTILYRDRPAIAAGATLAQVKANAVVTAFSATRDRISTREDDAAGRTAYLYDALDRTTGTAVQSYLYDAVGNRVATTDALGHLTRRSFDAAGRVVTVTDALNFVTTNTYDAQGNLVKLTDARGFSGYNYYDALGQVVLQIDPNGYVTQLSYDALGNVIEEKCYATALTGTYNETTGVDVLLGRLVSSTNDRKLTRAFDTRGLVQTITYFNTPSNYTEAFQYDAFGQKTQFTNKNGAVFNYEYSARGELKKEISPSVEVVMQVFPSLLTQMLRLETVTEYNAFGEGSVVREAAGTTQQRETRYFYDRAGRELRIEAPAFTVYDRATNTSTPKTPVTTRTFDTAGNLIKEVAPNGGVTVNYYDSRNLLVATVSADGVLSEFAYDAVGNRTRERIYGLRLTTAADPALKPTLPTDDYRELTHEFDAKNQRVLTQTRTETLYSTAQARISGVGYYTAPVITLAEYDQNGNLVKTQDGNGGVVRHYYDATGNKALTVDEEGYVTQWQYNAQGQVVREARRAGQLASTFHAALTPASTIQSILDAIPPGEDRVKELKYDALGRQIEERTLSVTYTVVDASTGTPTFVTADVVTSLQYDGVGNVLVRTAADGARADLAYDALDRKITQLDPQFQSFNGRGQALVTVRSQQQLKYDAHGNLVQELSLGNTAAENRQVRQSFDVAGNLRQRSEPAGATYSYEYDIAGNTVRTAFALRDVRATQHDYRTYASFDLLGREISRQDIADQGSATQVIRETQDVRYNAYGDVEAKGSNGQFQESFRYDRLGRLFYTHEQGSPTVFLYDANGNAVLKVKGVTTDLRQIQRPDDIRSLSVTQEQFTTSFYDKRNLLKSVVDAPMIFGTLTAAPPEVEGERLTPEQLRALQASLPTALALQGRVVGQATSGSSEFNNVPRGTTEDYRALGTLTTPGASLDPRTNANFGVTGGGEPVRSTPVSTLISDTGDADPAKRIVVEDIRQTVTTTEVTLEGNTVVKTITTEQRVTRRTTTFMRTRTETVDESGQTLEGEVKVTSTESNVTTGTVSQRIERTTRTATTETTTTLFRPGGMETGKLNLLPTQSFTVGGSSIRTSGNRENETANQTITISSPAIAGFGNDPAIVQATFVSGSLPPASYTGAIFFQQTKVGGIFESIGYSITKGGFVVASGFIDANASATRQIGPFIGIKQLPSGVTRGELTVFNSDGSIAGGPVPHAHVVGGASPTELIFREPSPGVFTSGRRYEYTLFSGNTIINRVQGTIGQDDGVVQTRTATRTFDKQVVSTQVDSGTVSNTAPVVASQDQDNYLLNLIRSITQGVVNENQIERKQTYNAFKEVTAQTDGRGFTTDLFYDKLGNLVRQLQPETQVYRDTGVAFSARPTTHYFYNQLSQLVGTQDANSAAGLTGTPYYSTRVLVNGLVEKEFDAKRNVTRHVYDRLGNERQQFDALNRETAYSHDLAGRLTRQERYETSGVLHSGDSYQYDEAGNRTKHTNALGVTEFETYLYDDQNRITQYTSFAGKKTGYDYTYSSTLAGIGGYIKVTTTEGVDGSDKQIEHTDIFGNLRYAEDLGGHKYTYEYNNAGLLSRQVGTTADASTGRKAQEITYKYFLNGLIQQIDDVGISAYSKFEYNKNGSRTKEIYSEVEIVAGLQDVHPYQVATAEHDELNRLKRTIDDGRFDIKFAYDAVGNRRSVRSDYFDLLRN